MEWIKIQPSEILSPSNERLKIVHGDGVGVGDGDGDCGVGDGFLCFSASDYR